MKQTNSTIKVTSHLLNESLQHFQWNNVVNLSLFKITRKSINFVYVRPRFSTPSPNREYLT